MRQGSPTVPVTRDDSFRQFLGELKSRDARGTNAGAGPPLIPASDSSKHAPGALLLVWTGTRSWLASTVVHVVAITTLAILSTHGMSRSVIELQSPPSEMSLRSLEEIQFDLSSVEPDSERAVSEARDLSSEEAVLEVLEEPVDVSFAEAFSLPGEIDQTLLSQLDPSLQTYEVRPAGSGSSFFGIEITGRNVVYIVDRSGSMEGARWESARKELIQSIESLARDQQFFVFLFSDSTHPMPQLAGRNKLVPASRDNIDEVKRWLMNQAPNSRTEPKGSVIRALNLNPDVVFLLSDGLFQDDTGAYLFKRARIRESVSEPETVVIHTIAFHSQEVWHVLRQIAESFGGTFRSVE